MIDRQDTLPEQATESTGGTHPAALPMGADTPYATWVLLVLNLVIFVIPALLDLVGVRFASFTMTELMLVFGAKDNASISLGGQYYRFLTVMFLHNGITHIAFNAWALYALGRDVERIYGTQRFLVIYGLAGLAGGVASYAFNASPSVGASGAIFGLIGALGVFFYESRRIFGGIARQQIGSLIFIVMINLGLGLATPFIDNGAHIGGLIGGGVAAWLLAPRLRVDPYLYPPVIVRQSIAIAWPGTLALLVVLVVLIVVITPPM